MRALPTEILSEIFLHLHQSDKLECMLVCSQWNKIMEEFALYHTLVIHTQDALKTLTDKIQQNPQIQNRVERLILCSQYSLNRHRLESITLYNKLPNLKTYANFNCMNIAGDITCSNADRTQYIFDYFDAVMTYKMLLSNTFSNLTKLYVNNGAEDIVNFYEALGNAPNLKHLQTVAFSITNIQQIDTIHENLPGLETLRFKKVKYTGDDVFRWNNTPAASITDFSFDFIQVSPSPDKIVHLLNYISKKYPTLSALTFKSKHNDELTDNDISIINKNGWVPLLNGLGNQLKKLSVNMGANIRNLLAVLDASRCQLKYLELDAVNWRIYHDMELSHQSRYIQSLVVHYWGQNRHFSTFDWTNSFNALDKVEIHSHEHKIIKFSRILAHLAPTLTTLSINYSTLRIYPDPTPLCNIRTLIFNEVNLQDNTDDFISAHFPKLSSLTLKGCWLLKRHFNLEQMDLLCFRYRPGKPKDNYRLLLSTHGNGEKHLYTMTSSQHEVQCYEKLNSIHEYTPYQPFKSRPVKGNNISYDFYFTCNSVVNLEFI